MNNENTKVNKVLVVVGPSGVGKGTLIGKIREEYPEKFAFKISHTTRKPRDGEVDGKHYYFISKEEFEKVIKNKDIYNNIFNDIFFL
jgi:guanylate kinase